MKILLNTTHTEARKKMEALRDKLGGGSIPYSFLKKSEFDKYKADDKRFFKELTDISKFKFANENNLPIIEKEEEYNQIIADFKSAVNVKFKDDYNAIVLRTVKEYEELFETVGHLENMIKEEPQGYDTLHNDLLAAKSTDNYEAFKQKNHTIKSLTDELERIDNMSISLGGMHNEGTPTFVRNDILYILGPFGDAYTQFKGFIYGTETLSDVETQIKEVRQGQLDELNEYYGVIKSLLETKQEELKAKVDVLINAYNEKIATEELPKDRSYFEVPDVSDPVVTTDAIEEKISNIANEINVVTGFVQDNVVDDNMKMEPSPRADEIYNAYNTIQNHLEALIEYKKQLEEVQGRLKESEKEVSLTNAKRKLNTNKKLTGYKSMSKEKLEALHAELSAFRTELLKYSNDLTGSEPEVEEVKTKLTEKAEAVQAQITKVEREQTEDQELLLEIEKVRTEYTEFDALLPELPTSHNSSDYDTYISKLQEKINNLKGIYEGPDGNYPPSINSILVANEDEEDSIDKKLLLDALQPAKDKVAELTTELDKITKKKDILNTNKEKIDKAKELETGYESLIGLISGSSDNFSIATGDDVSNAGKAIIDAYNPGDVEDNRSKLSLIDNPENDPLITELNTKLTEVKGKYDKAVAVHKHYTSHVVDLNDVDGLVAKYADKYPVLKVYTDAYSKEKIIKSVQDDMVISDRLDIAFGNNSFNERMNTQRILIKKAIAGLLEDNAYNTASHTQTIFVEIKKAFKEDINDGVYPELTPLVENAIKESIKKKLDAKVPENSDDLINYCKIIDFVIDNPKITMNHSTQAKEIETLVDSTETKEGLTNLKNRLAEIKKNISNDDPKGAKELLEQIQGNFSEFLGNNSDINSSISSHMSSLDVLIGDIGKTEHIIDEKIAQKEKEDADKEKDKENEATIDDLTS